MRNLAVRLSHMLRIPGELRPTGTFRRAPLLASMATAAAAIALALALCLARSPPLSDPAIGLVPCPSHPTVPSTGPPRLAAAYPNPGYPMLPPHAYPLPQVGPSQGPPGGNASAPHALPPVAFALLSAASPPARTAAPAAAAGVAALKAAGTLPLRALCDARAEACSRVAGPLATAVCFHMEVRARLHQWWKSKAASTDTCDKRHAWMALEYSSAAGEAVTFVRDLRAALAVHRCSIRNPRCLR